MSADNIWNLPTSTNVINVTRPRSLTEAQWAVALPFLQTGCEFPDFKLLCRLWDMAGCSLRHDEKTVRAVQNHLAYTRRHKASMIDAAEVPIIRE